MAGSKMLVAVALMGLMAGASAKVFFQEKFDDSWTDRWTKSSWKQSDSTDGDFTHTAGLWHGDAEADKGIQTGPDARFYSISASAAEKFGNEGTPLVLQFSVKHEQKLDCGGGYIKLLPESSVMADFGGDTPYSIMFGPDMCGTSTKRVHVIFTYKEKNLLTKKTITCETDQLTHVYTLIVNPDKTYAVLIDNVEKETGSLEEDWDFLPSAKIADPDATKPEDWDEEAMIDDPEDVKPDGFDDIPEKIPDPEAEKPEDWDDEDDGEWEAPMMDNPEFQGEWSAKRIDNPNYKGKWEAAQIDNPEYEADSSIGVFTDLKHVGFELWQVKAGSIFDNIFVGDSPEEAKAFAEETWGANKDAEKAMFDAAESDKTAKEAEERKKADEERKALEDEEEEDSDDAPEAEAEEEEHDEL
jgi:calreticulin